jgi:hypothetical protein
MVFLHEHVGKELEGGMVRFRSLSSANALHAYWCRPQSVPVGSWILVDTSINCKDTILLIYDYSCSSTTYAGLKGMWITSSSYQGILNYVKE